MKLTTPTLLENMEQLPNGVYRTKGDWGAHNGAHFKAPEAPGYGKTARFRFYRRSENFPVAGNIKPVRAWSEDFGSLPNVYFATPFADRLDAYPYRLYVELMHMGLGMPQYAPPMVKFPMGDGIFRHEVFTFKMPSSFGAVDGLFKVEINGTMLFASNLFAYEGEGTDRAGNPTTFRGLPTYYCCQLNLNKSAPENAYVEVGEPVLEYL